jgi:hypothetical protein
MLDIFHFRHQIRQLYQFLGGASAGQNNFHRWVFSF